jgi:hypothetical protein
MRADEPQPTNTPTCTEQWQCASVSLDYNYVGCIGGLCKCKDGFSGDATLLSKCSCLAPKTLSWVNNQATCVAAQVPDPTETPILSCTEQWQCASVSLDYNYVLCVAGKCACRDGFSGNATTGNKCSCLAPNVISWVNNQATCVAPQVPNPTDTPILTCTEQWQCASVSEDYNYVRCIAGKCACKAGFLGNATTGNKCSCPTPNTVSWVNNEAVCSVASIPEPTTTPSTCSAQWECASVSLDYNYVLCVAGKCACRDGFSGNATAGNKCSCLAPNVISWVNNQVSCAAPVIPEPTTTPSTCSAQWECLAVSSDYDFVRCIAGACTCKDGFSGNATAGNKCSCIAPKLVIWDTDQFKCVDPQLPTPVDTPLSCTEQWECSPVSLDYNFVGCVAGKCACRDGFSGNATAGNKCSCLAPKTISWVNNQATCVALPTLKRGRWSQY